MHKHTGAEYEHMEALRASLSKFCYTIISIFPCADLSVIQLIKSENSAFISIIEYALLTLLRYYGFNIYIKGMKSNVHQTPAVGPCLAGSALWHHLYTYPWVCNNGHTRYEIVHGRCTVMILQPISSLDSL